MVSIVVAAQPGTAIYHAVNGGFSLTDHLLATMYEQQAGLVDPKERIARPGVTDTRSMRMPDLRDPKVKKLTFDSMTIDDFEALRRERIKGAC